MTCITVTSWFRFYTIMLLIKINFVFNHHFCSLQTFVGVGFKSGYTNDGPRINHQITMRILLQLGCEEYYIMPNYLGHYSVASLYLCFIRPQHQPRHQQHLVHPHSLQPPRPPPPHPRLLAHQSQSYAAGHSAQMRTQWCHLGPSTDLIQ